MPNPENINDTIKLDEFPLVTYSGEVVQINTLEEVDSACENISQSPVLGFDTESRPTLKKGTTRQIAILQIYDGEKAYLFKIKKTGFHEKIKQIMENPAIIKVGAAIKEDINVLAKEGKFKPANFVDLQTLAEKIQIPDRSVKKMTAHLLGFRISKKQQLSNWENEKLTEAQIAYAATDAWVCYQMYFKMINILNNKQ